MSDNIPLEIQVEIMKRLPVKSLVQFRSVSKAWKSLIDSSHFIVDYSSQDTQVQHLLVRYRHNFEHKYVSVVDDDTFPEQKVYPTVPLLVDMLKYSIMIGSSHGLLCLYCIYQGGLGRPNSGMDMAVLWNLSIRKAVAVVVPNTVHGESFETSLGFGVLRETNDPKIVKITYIDSWKDMESISCIPWQVEVFTLSTGAWRSPYSTDRPRKSIRFGYFKVVIDGILYWLATDRRITVDGEYRSSSNLIVSFDMTSEEFREVNLPHSIAHQSYINVSLFKLKESLVVLELSREANKLVFYVWMMEDGVSKLFTKLFTVNFQTPYGFVGVVIGFRKTGEPIIECLLDRGDFTGSVAVYEPYTNSINNLGINGERFSFSVFPYMETLLLLDQPDSVIYYKGKRYFQSGEVITEGF